MFKTRCSRGIFAQFLRLRRTTAAGLVLFLVAFTTAPQMRGQQSASTGSQTKSSTATPAQGTPGSPVPIPQPTLEQSVKARESFQKGTAALKRRESAEAVKLLAEAHRIDPANASYLAAYEIARQQQLGMVLQAARDDRRQGNLSKARQRLQAALKLAPGNPYVQEDVESMAVESEPAVIAAAPMPRFSSGLVELAPTSSRATFHLRASARQIIRRVFQTYGVTALLDDSVPTKNVDLNLDNTTFGRASTAVQLCTGTFVVPLDSTHALVAKDTKENRTKFQRLLMETVYLPGVSAKEMSSAVNLIRNVFGVHQISSRPDSGVMSIRAPEGDLWAINATLSHLYLARPDIVLDVRVYQVSDTRQQKAGLSFPQSLSVFNVSSELSSIIASNQSTVEQLIAAGLVNPGDLAGIAALLVGMGLANGTILNQPFALFGNGLTLSGLTFPGGSVNASLTLSKTRELDHVQLRAGDAQKQAFLVGSRYPVVTQSYSAGTQIPTNSQSLAGLISGSNSSATSSVNPLSYAPTVEYINLGLTVKAVAQVVRNNNVSIQLQVDLASLSGSSLNESPIVDNRSFTTQIQVPNGGSALITSNISQTESRSLSGIPGLSELPGFAWTASPSTQLTVGKLLIVISPHIVSATHSTTASPMFELARSSVQ